MWGSERATALSPGKAATVSHVQLFLMPNVDDVRAHLLAQDVIWVGGGSVANLLAVWRVRGSTRSSARRGKRASSSEG